MPQQRDLLAQPAPDVSILGAREAWVVELVQQPVATPEREQQGSATGVGGVRGEHQADLQPLSMRAAGLERGVDRALQHASWRGSALLAQPSDPLLLLRQVGQLEIQAEGADQ